MGGVADVVSTGVTAIATAVLAWFGWVQIRSEQRHRESEQRSADTRLTAAAFELRKPLVAWILKSQEKGWSVNMTQDGAQTVGSVLPKLAQELASATAASPVAAAHLRSAYALCQSAAVKFDASLGDYYRSTQAQLHHPTAPVQLGGQGSCSDARESVRGCCHMLEQMIDSALLSEAKRLGAWQDV